MAKKAVVIVLLVLLFALAIPAAAGNPNRVGERIDVFSGSPTTYPADTPFHIEHGWTFTIGPDNDMKASGVYDFDLYVDGVYVKQNFVDFEVQDPGTGSVRKVWVHNFPDGMTGTHTFLGKWYWPCSITEGPCETPNQKVEALSTTLTVTFGP